MAEQDMEEDLFADLYDGEADDPTPANPTQTEQQPTQSEAQNDSVEPTANKQDGDGDDFNIKTDMDAGGPGFGNMPGMQMDIKPEGNFGGTPAHAEEERPISMKDDGKMFIGGLNWETTDESLKSYFTQFGEVIECTVMRDGATGRSRGFGFLTFKDPKVVNTVMVKEHTLDGKLIDPKRAIPRDEQERTAKIFVGGVSQDASQEEFANFFRNFGNVLDATLMMDKETGRPRGFGFVTFDSEAAVDRTLEGPLAICGKPIEVKRAQPRGDMREENNARGGKFGRKGQQDQYSQYGAQQQMGADANGGGNQMTPAMMAAYWQKMQQYFQMMQQQMAANNMGGGMNQMAMMNNPMMQQMMQRQGMNPAMMQQMGAMQQGGMGRSQTGSPMNQPPQPRPGFNAQEQLSFEQQKYERQAMQRGGPSNQQFNGNGGGAWEGMYDENQNPMGAGAMRGGFGGGRGGRGGRAGSQGPTGGTPAPPQAPANAPTGPKNAGRPGANYRGGGRGGHRGFHPYARGGS
ncbi:RNA-binding domain-containing protein [Hortaea werneckii]|nr:RNA-binding domain-containing protein [Hortaea werneckii]KAI7321039.1 RNA-binding domain-containing protein [Hortaea werneckii]